MPFEVRSVFRKDRNVNRTHFDLDSAMLHVVDVKVPAVIREYQDDGNASTDVIMTRKTAKRV
jgi:hypothetical protein